MNERKVSYELTFMGVAAGDAMIECRKRLSAARVADYM